MTSDAEKAARGNPVPQSAGDAQPESIGKYHVVRLLGRGGMGTVFQAFDPHLERDVALKMMLPQFADQPEHKLRFEREARAVARMMHPNVVTVFDLGYHTDGSPYIVMELLKGRDLLHVLREDRALTLRRKLTIVIQVLEGLGHAHKVGIVHRDIKPGNVFIVESGDAKIMDFGIARISEAGAAASMFVVGTANYMSPEQISDGTIDGRSDLFSVGCMLAEMVTGHPPFEADNAMATLYRIAHGEPTLALPDDDEGRELTRILRRSLARNLDERIPTAAEFSAALLDLVEQPSFGTTPAAGTATAPGPDLAPTRALGARAVPAPTPPQAADPTPLFRLLRDIYVGGKSGHLHLTSGHERRRLRLLRGRIVDGSSDVAGERLGDVLVRYGLLSQADLERAVAVVLRERRKLGQVLGEMGLLDRPRLEDAIGLHVREVLFVMLDRPGASFLFEEMSESLIEAEAVCRLSTGEVILEATRRVQDPALVRRAIGDPARVLVLADSLLRAQKMTLTPADGFVLSRIDGTLSAREVLSLIPLPAEDVERSLFGLLCTGMVGHLDDQPLPRSTPRRAETAPPTPQSMARVMPPSPPPTPQSMASVAPPSTTAPSTKSATPVAPASGTGSVPAARPASPSAGTPVATPAAADSRSSRLTPEEVRRIILTTHERLAERTHYEVLGIERGASDGEVRQAHARLIRALHPDACAAPELDDVQEQRAAVFVRVGQAFEVLRDLKARAAYDTQLKRLGPQPTPASGSDAAASRQGSPGEGGSNWLAEALATAEAHLAEEKYWDVIQTLEPVVSRIEGSQRARARYLLARAYAKNPKWKHRAEDALRAAIEDDPRQVEAPLLLARIYAEAGLQARANAMYRKVLAVDPQHAEARAGEKATTRPTAAEPQPPKRPPGKR